MSNMLNCHHISITRYMSERGYIQMSNSTYLLSSLSTLTYADQVIFYMMLSTKDCKLDCVPGVTL